MERFKVTDPEAYDVLFGEKARADGKSVVRIDVDGDVEPLDAWVIVGVDALETLKAEKETAERALLKTWVMQESSRFGCVHCMAGPQATVAAFEHTPDCIIPALVERYA